MACWSILLIAVMAVVTMVQTQDNNGTDYREYEYYEIDPVVNPFEPTNPTGFPETPTTTTFTFPPTTTPSFEVQRPTVPDISPIVEQIDQSCCAIPSLDCSLVNQQMQGASKDAHGVSFLNPTRLGNNSLKEMMMMMNNYTDDGTGGRGGGGDFNVNASRRYRRQVPIQEQYVDQLGINLLRFESCLCQANRSPSACRMLFPPGFYTPNRPGLFDVIFNSDLVVKRFRCSFYNGNIVDCLFQSLASYDPLAAPMVYFVVNDKAELSGRQCITCNSMYCTFDAFKNRNLGTNKPFNQDYAECVAKRSGTPIPTTTTTTQKPFWTGPPIKSSDHVLDNKDEISTALKDLSQITRRGFLMGLGTPGGQTTLAERYNIRVDLHGGHHPILHHDDHEKEHHDHNYVWVMVLAIAVGLLAGTVLVFLIVYCLRRKTKSKVKVQRSLRGLPIVKLDVLDPSPFCGGAGGGRSGMVMDNDYEYRGGVSDMSLYGMTAGNGDSLKYSTGDAAPPVARVVPFPKPNRKPSKQHPLPAPPISRNVRSSSSNVPHNHGHVEGSRFRGHSSSSSPNSRHRGNKTTTIHETDNDSVFLPRRPEIRVRNIASSSSIRSDASSVHIYTAAASRRPKVPPRSPANTLNNRSDNNTNTSTINAAAALFNQGTLGAAKPQVLPRTPRNIAKQQHESASRTSSSVSASSGRSLLTQQQRSDNVFSTSPAVIHRSISKQRSNLPSTSSSRGSKGVPGFYYDVDEEFEDYNDIYASIDEAEEGEDDDDDDKYDDDDDDDNDDAFENARKKGHSRYETRICPSQEIFTDTIPEDFTTNPTRQSGRDPASQYEVPVRSAALLDKPAYPSIPMKPARMNHLLPPSVTVLANSLPSAIAPPVPQRTRPASSSSSSDTDSSSVQGDPRDSKYADHSNRLENEYTTIRDDLVQTALKYS